MAWPSGNGASEYNRLENRLVLLAWLNSLFGYKSNRELLADMQQAQEGFDPSGRSYMYHRLASRGSQVRIPLPVLAGYDDNIRVHLAAINARRPEPITLRYFQYLAALYAEVFLDCYFNHPGELVRLLNEFVTLRNASVLPGDPKDPFFGPDDLTKLAFWMATGSGKTLIMHLNYHQFLHYNHRWLDHILLITPNENLSAQHIADMEASGVPCAHLSLEESSLELGGRNVVRVIEITKLVEEKRGGGISIGVESFEGNNLIFVDEGHKGSGGEAWRRFRDLLGQTGFTFEYSATFGQALTAARNDALTTEYGKAIVFDYSYKYFYGDGYGKDFHILNLREETAEGKTEILLLGNLLSFYEQQRCFTEQSDLLRPYNLEKPLWVFVGSSVNAVYRESGRPRSDVLTVARFLHHFLENKDGWAIQAIQQLITGQSGLIDQGEDIFAQRFDYLRGERWNAERIYGDILERVFHAAAGGGLHLSDIRGSAGELGLKVSGAEDYFGLIYIGDTSSFKRLVESDASGIVLEDDAVSPSLFDAINQLDTAINVLIGAKKFMEGWNSWRVSNMGLLNIGRSEGSEIIQLFGRGIRLRGLNSTLKRSAAIEGAHPAHIKLLEVLNIFAVRANYMAQFRDYLQREGVETAGYVTLPLPVRHNADFLGKGLVVPRLRPGRNFADECNIILAPDPAARVTVDLSLKVQSMRSSAIGLKTAMMKADQEQVIPAESLNLIQWDRLYLNLLEYKEQKGFSNLVVQPDALRAILQADEPRLYRLVADEAVVKPRSFAGTDLLQDAALSILRKYLDRYYYVCQERWGTPNMDYQILDGQDPNFRDYTVIIPRSERELIEAVTALIVEGDRLYRQEVRELPNIHFEQHLYQPLLVQRGDKIKSDPPGLNDSEQRFVRILREYVRAEAGKSLASKEVFLLRNLSRGRGIGFFEKEGFYPDFILWIKERQRQRIVFVEPHGMQQERTYEASDKAQLYMHLQELSQTWATRSGKDVCLDSFIVSATPYEELRDYYGDGNWSKQQFANAHILFFDNLGDCMPLVLGS